MIDDDFMRKITELMPKTPIGWIGCAMTHLQIAYELQAEESEGVWDSHRLRNVGCDPAQHINSLLSAWDVLEDVLVQSCTVILACGCHINNMWDEWAFDPCDAHIKALDGRNPIDFWLQTEEGERHVTDSKTLPYGYHKPFRPPTNKEALHMVSTGDVSQVGHQFIHMIESYKNKHDSFIAERLIRSVDNATDLD